MQILRGLDQLNDFLDRVDCSEGCLADTGFLYGMAYNDDSFYPQALDVSLILEEMEIPIHTNVVGRMEFIDLVFRKMLTRGAVKLYKSMDSQTPHRNLFNFVKKVRDQEVSERRKRKSYKIGEKSLKALRKDIVAVSGMSGWKAFCSTYAGDMLSNEWRQLEEDFGLYFIEVMEGQTSEQVTRPLLWADMVNTMGTYGVRGPDAMILNLFRSCSLNLLITSDNDFNFEEIDDPELETKGVLILQESQPDASYLREIQQDL
jgi:hypothetical protein